VSRPLRGGGGWEGGLGRTLPGSGSRRQAWHAPSPSLPPLRAAAPTRDPSLTPSPAPRPPQTPSPVLTHAKNRALRQEMYVAYVTRASSGDGDNTPIIDTVLALRQEKAKLLGFANFAELSMASKVG
jgi:hypothetical protein